MGGEKARNWGIFMRQHSAYYRIGNLAPRAVVYRVLCSPERGVKKATGVGVTLVAHSLVGSSAAGVRVYRRANVCKQSLSHPCHASVLYVGECKAGADMGQLSTWG